MEWLWKSLLKYMKHLKAKSFKSEEDWQLFEEGILNESKYNYSVL